MVLVFMGIGECCLVEEKGDLMAIFSLKALITYVLAWGVC